MADETGSDDALLAELAILLRPRTEVPREVVEAAKQSFTWRTVDAELAALTYDSLLDDEPAGVRAAAQPRILTFEADGLTIELELDAGPSGRRLMGQIVPPQETEIELLSAGEPAVVRSDELGRFAVALPANRQRVMLRWRPAGGGVVESGWTMM